MEPDLQTPEVQEAAPKKATKGGLPIGLVSTIQKLYKQAQPAPQPGKQGPISTGLQSGWGGGE